MRLETVLLVASAYDQRSFTGNRRPDYNDMNKRVIAELGTAHTVNALNAGEGNAKPF